MRGSGCPKNARVPSRGGGREKRSRRLHRSEEHTSELQSRQYLVCRLLLEKKTITGADGKRISVIFPVRPCRVLRLSLPSTPISGVLSPFFRFVPCSIRYFEHTSALTSRHS